MSRRFDLVSLVAGVAVVVLGGVLLLDQEDVIELTLGLAGALVAATIGVVLLASGLAPPEDRVR